MEPCSLNIVIRADCGPGIGTGHLMRMLALGQACVQVGGCVTMAVGVIPGGLKKRILNSGIQLHVLKHSNGCLRDAQETLQIANGCKADWIAIDGYRFDYKYQAQVAETQARLLMMDDGEQADLAVVDLVLNQNAYATIPAGRTRVDYLAGCEYTLLRTEFLAEAACEPKHVVKLARRILVTFGGSDEDDWTSVALRAIEQAGNERTIVDAVVGAGYPNLDALLHLKRELKYNVRIHRNVDRMVDLMSRVDMAVTAGGSTCYELARCGVPSLAIAVADNQRSVVDELVRREAIVQFEPEGSAGELHSAIRRLMRDDVTRNKLSSNGQRLVDGHGSLRIARRLANYGVELRPVEMADEQLLLHWRNDPEVRSVSFQTAPVSIETHRAWLKNKLADPKIGLWIAEDQRNEPVGQVRFEFNNHEATISITIDHARRARGLGKVLIERACRKVFEQHPELLSVVALIKIGNVASERAFRNAGFTQATRTMVESKLASKYVLHRETVSRIRKVA